MKRCHGRLHSDRKFQIFIFLIWYININKGVFCLIISYLRIKSYNVLNYNNCSTDWHFLLSSKLGKIPKKNWEWWPFLRCLPKHIKISKCYNFNENWYLEDFRPEECDSYKCDLKMVAIATIMVAILTTIFNIYRQNT